MPRVAAGATALALLLAGCSMAPPYHVPATPTPVAFKEAGPWAPAAPSDSNAGNQWWTAYGDPTLDKLEERVQADNPTLASALARYDEARAYLGEARAALLPQVGLDAQVTDNRQSDNRPLRGANQPDLYPADTLGGSVSYELDLWGRIRDTVAGRRAQVQASADDLAGVRLGLETQLALTYVTLRGLDAEAALLDATVDAYQQADALTQRRFKGGIASGLDVSRSGAQLAEAQAQLSDIKAARALAEHALARLVGVAASDFSLAPAEMVITVPAVPTGLPSSLLQRRPDIAAAERRVNAANAGIGVARAAFFPSISLGGSGGYQNTGIADLLAAPNIFWSVGPSAVLNLFDGGRRRARIEEARAVWSLATADYRDRVLRAFQEVEDGLAQLHHLGDEAQAEARAAQMASDVEAMSLNRYQKGAVSYLDVVTAQATALRTRRTALELRTRQLRASIALTEALGGGWHDQTASL